MLLREMVFYPLLAAGLPPARARPSRTMRKPHERTVTSRGLWCDDCDGPGAWPQWSGHACHIWI